MVARSGLGRPGVCADGRGTVHFSKPRLYNPCVMSLVRHPRLLVLAVLVAAFVAFYPSLEAAASCDGGECPYTEHATTTASVCLAAVALSAPYAAPVLGVISRRRLFPERRPAEVYLPTDTRPPKPS